MCINGHGLFATHDDKCIMCGLKKDNKYCHDCCQYAYDHNMDYNESSYTYCSECRMRNSETIKKRIKFDAIKSSVIATELLKNPTLEMDLLCSMKRRAALDSIIYDINKLEWTKRMKWCLMVMDLDHLKCWNDSLGHVKTDELIKIIGGIMTSNINDINNGKWNGLNRGIVYRFVLFFYMFLK